MPIEKDYTTKLAAGDVTVDRRDVEMLRAIDREGSMHAAADALGRSYARLQNRVVELEAAVGDLTERRRGGTDGGGTTLTDTARDLLRTFDRHRAELDGVARVTESVFSGPVVDREGELGTVETAAGRIFALVPPAATDVEVSVRSDAVVLTDPDETPDADGTSLRNRFAGTVDAVDSGDAIARVTVALAPERSLRALVTAASRDRLELAPGRRVDASFKATAARATAVRDEE